MTEKKEFSENLDKTRKAKIEKGLAEAIAKFENKYPEIAKRRKKIQQGITLLEEATIINWSLPFED